jgi:methylated-DNA-[protein]-cysteine S-methyltransferase
MWRWNGAHGGQFLNLPGEFMRYATLDSPIGPLLLAGDAEGLRYLSFVKGDRPAAVAPDWREDPASFDRVMDELKAYFAGRLMRFTVRLAPRGTTFQLRVWHALCEIPYGETISYGELARRIGDAKASRAVGLANGANPLAIIVPCHRVIGSNGSLTGYGGGLPIKQALLALERGQQRLV